MRSSAASALRDSSSPTHHFLEQHPNPTADDIRRGLSGNFCRCGTYDGIRAVALATAPEGRSSMSEYQWPDPATRPLLGKRISRVDGPVKVSGRAKYTYDYNPDGLLAGKILRCPYAHARITSIDTSAAEKMPGVKAVRVIQQAGNGNLLGRRRSRRRRRRG